MTNPDTMVSSPSATGGEGTHFEQHVDAAFLAWLLVGGIPPILINSTITEVAFQTNRLGWNTDDLLVTAKTSSGIRRQLVCQVKQSIRISSTDSEFVKTITDAWKDFHSDDFDRDKDKLAIIVLRGTDVFLRHFAGLLDTAKSARTISEFSDRLSTKGLVHSKVVSHYREVEAVVRAITDEEISDEELWTFLTSLHAVSFDLNTPTRQTESQVISLLAYTAEGTDPVESADTTWKHLLSEVGEGKPRAKTYRYQDLPDKLRRRHSSIGGREQAALQRLSEHSKPVVSRIRTSIGDSEQSIEMPRGEFIQAISEALEESDIVLISGGAGSGKSAVAKRVFQRLHRRFFTFAFQAEEFSTPHLDQTLLNAQVDLNATTLASVLGGQPQKLLLIESIERLLESSTREAFAHLLELVRSDRTWRVLLTCRDYSADVVRSSLLDRSGLAVECITVPSLTDDELGFVVQKCPALTQPLGSDRLRDLLRNPYLLDKATQMSWPSDRALPENERAFRERFWHDVIRADHYPANGMPRKREAAFGKVAVQRAKSLTPYAARDEADDEATDRLIRDSLLLVSDRTDSLVAPAHDVLEDWAVLRWIDEQHAQVNGELDSLAKRLGAFPAIRRGYRKWLNERVQQQSADSVFQQALNTPSLPAYFGDDTLLGLLRSANPSNFLHRNSATLFQDEKAVLRRVMHLLRIGCKERPSWLTGDRHEFYVPEGHAWSCVLELIAEQIDTFGQEDFPLLIGLIEDAATAASLETPYPPTSSATVQITHALLPHFSDYRGEEQRERLLRIVAKYPLSNETKFRELMQGDTGRSGRNSSPLRNIVLFELNGQGACRDFPLLVMEATRIELLLTDDDLQPSNDFMHAEQGDAGFGVRPWSDRDCFPASAYQGPFFFLLRHHFIDSMRFLIEIFDHCTNWYAADRVRMDYVERPTKVSLSFSDETRKEQWGNERLWNLYRGTSVGPYMLQSALMALERRLLEVAISELSILDTVLMGILHNSESVALTAVVASVATAHPESCANALQVMLRSRFCTQLDKIRLTQEMQRPSQLTGLMPSAPGSRIHDRERAESDKLPHRSRDLEQAILLLQFGNHAESTQKIIDEHLAHLPEETDRNDEDRKWLLALRRMDLRHYKQTVQPVEPIESSGGSSTVQVRFDLAVTDDDVLQMSEDAMQEHQAREDRVGLLMWGIKVFSGESPTEYDPDDWRARLTEAQQTIGETGATLGEGGPEFVASVCIRDHYDELSADELRWCVITLCTAVESSAHDWSYMARIQQYSMAGDRPAAATVFAIRRESIPEDLVCQVDTAITLAITHSNDEVRRYASAGAGQYLWSLDSELACHCVAVLADEASLVQLRLKSENEKPFSDRMDVKEIEYHVAQQIREQFFEPREITRYEDLDISDWTGSEANRHILAILNCQPESPHALTAFSKVAKVLVQWWDDNDDRRNRRHRREYSHKVEMAISSLLESFVLQVDMNSARSILSPIVEAMDRHPRECSHIIQGIISAQDVRLPMSTFWPLWQLFADRLPSASWLSEVDDEYSRGRDLLAAIFLTNYWKEETRKWTPLSDCPEGDQSHRLATLLGTLPPLPTILDCYVRFLYHIGEPCLPSAFVIVSSHLQGQDVRELLSLENTVFMLETVLRRYVFGRPMELKSNSEVRDAVLFLLDSLIEAGSSSAFRMRDDFVTPIAKAHTHNQGID